MDRRITFESTFQPENQRTITVKWENFRDLADGQFLFLRYMTIYATVTIFLNQLEYLRDALFFNILLTKMDRP